MPKKPYKLSFKKLAKLSEQVEKMKKESYGQDQNKTPEYKQGVDGT